MLAMMVLAAALYRSGDHLYSLTKTDSDALLLLEYDTGRLSRLRLEEDRWVGGPSIGVDNPIAVRVQIKEDKLTIERDSSTIVANRFDAFTIHQVAGGTLFVPRRAGRHPALVAIPGAGLIPAPYFARRGVAYLALERRPDWRSRTFDDVAGEVIAAIAALQKRRDIDPKRIGVYGSSQGGWIAPIAAVRSPSIAFVVCAACPATDLTTQEVIRTEAELRADGFAAGEIQEAVAYRKLFFEYIESGAHQSDLEAADEKARKARWYPRFGGIIGRDSPLAVWWQKNARYVPTDSWKEVRVPALLLFGSLDTRVPAVPHAQRIAAADRAVKVLVVPNVDHEGFIARTGGRDEVPLLDRIPPRAIEPTIDWILALH